MLGYLMVRNKSNIGISWRSARNACTFSRRTGLSRRLRRRAQRNLHSPARPGGSRCASWPRTRAVEGSGRRQRSPLAQEGNQSPINDSVRHVHGRRYQYVGHPQLRLSPRLSCRCWSRGAYPGGFRKRQRFCPTNDMSADALSAYLSNYSRRGPRSTRAHRTDAALREKHGLLKAMDGNSV
jgi:hypothetical protein